MSIVLVGGMDRLGPHYIDEAKKYGCTLQIFNRANSKMTKKLQNADALVVFTNKVSHQARNEAMATAKRKGIPVYMYHSCGLCTLRECFKCLKPD